MAAATPLSIALAHAPGFADAALLADDPREAVFHSMINLASVVLAAGGSPRDAELAGEAIAAVYASRVRRIAASGSC